MLSGWPPQKVSAILQENAQLKQLNAEAEERTRKANQRQQADIHKQVVKRIAVGQLTGRHGHMLC